MAISAQKVTFTGSLGETLAARLERPEGTVRAYALFAHCFTCSKDIFAAARIAEGLARQGIAVLRFDFTGLGMSGGDFANTNFTSNVQDLIAAAEFLRENYEAPDILVGHSLGGAAVLAAAEHVPEAVAVATIGAPSNASHVAHNFADKTIDIERDGEAEVDLSGRKFVIRKQFLDDIRGHTLTDKIGSLKKALLVFHSPLDSQVSVTNANEIFSAAKHPKSFVSLDKADHLLRDRDDANYVADVLSAWAERYIDTPQPAKLDPLPAGVVAVRETRTSKFQQQIRVGEHEFFGDEPKRVGGQDTGPAPYDLLLAALGTCTAMTMRLYADRKGIAVPAFSVKLSHAKEHAQDCADCEEGSKGLLDVIRREIIIEGAHDEATRAKLLEIADKCPVHKTLHNSPQVITKLGG